MEQSLTQSRYRVEGMDCGGCAAKIATAARRSPGVTEVAVSVASGTMVIHHSAESDLAMLEKRVTALGYGLERLAQDSPKPNLEDHDHSQCCGHGDGHAHDDGRVSADPEAGPAKSSPFRLSRKGVLTLSCGLALIAAYALGKAAPGAAPYAFLAALLVGLAPIAQRAFVAARQGTPFSIEMLMTVAAIGAFVIDAREEAAAVVFLFLVGEMLEGLAARRARASIQSLAALTPATAQRERGGVLTEVASASLRPGDVIVARPGDRISADGVILSGDSRINQAPVTGESLPVHKMAGAKVFAGSLNGEGVLRVEVTASAADNTIARVVKLVEEAQESKAPTERFIERFARIYTPAVVGVAALVAVVPPLVAGASWQEWIYKALAVLLIGCPCALVISTPAAIAASLAAGARRGLLLKGGAVLETLGRVNMACFDKTGTLTEGKPKVTDVIGFDRDENEVLALAAAVEATSNHPLAGAVLAEAQARGLRAPAAIAAAGLSGKGVSATVDGQNVFLGSARAAGEQAVLTQEQAARIAVLNTEGKTVSVLVVGAAAAGVLALRDEPRADAAAGVAALKRAGVRVAMLTGDNRRTAEAVGASLGVETHAELMPADKQRIVRDLQKQGLVVAKIGDGVNDAPALAAADVGVAMGGGADVALEAADAAILHGRVGDVAALIALSRRTLRNIRQNVTIALGLKAAFLVTTLVGLTGLWPAILADTGATVIVTANALRLLRVNGDHT